MPGCQKTGTGPDPQAPGRNPAISGSYTCGVVFHESPGFSSLFTNRGTHLMPGYQKSGSDPDPVEAGPHPAVFGLVVQGRLQLARFERGRYPRNTKYETRNSESEIL